MGTAVEPERLRGLEPRRAGAGDRASAGADRWSYCPRRSSSRHRRFGVRRWRAVRRRNNDTLEHGTTKNQALRLDHARRSQERVAGGRVEGYQEEAAPIGRSKAGDLRSRGRSAGVARRLVARDRRVARESAHDRQVPRPRLSRSGDGGAHPRPSREEARHRHREGLPPRVRDDPGEGEDDHRAQVAGQGFARGVHRDGPGPRRRGDRVARGRADQARQRAGPPRALP